MATINFIFKVCLKSSSLWIWNSNKHISYTYIWEAIHYDLQGMEMKSVFSRGKVVKIIWQYVENILQNIYSIIKLNDLSKSTEYQNVYVDYRIYSHIGPTLIPKQLTTVLLEHVSKISYELEHHTVDKHIISLKMHCTINVTCVFQW